MNVVTAIGLGAAVCTTIAYVPQVMKAWRSKSTADVSTGMFLLMTFGVLLWLAYGVLLGDLPLILSNGVTLCLTGTMLLFKLRMG